MAFRWPGKAPQRGEQDDIQGTSATHAGIHPHRDFHRFGGDRTVVVWRVLAIAPVLQQTKITETNDKLDRLEDALILYAIQFGCLPCPADGTVVSTAGGAGLAEDDTGTYATQCADDNGGAACRTESAAPGDNVVPWATLGLSESDATDAWGNRFYYEVSSTLIDNGDMNRTAGPTYPAGNLTVTDVTPVNLTTVAAYALFSFGPDGSDARAAQTAILQTDTWVPPMWTRMKTLTRTQHSFRMLSSAWKSPPRILMTWCAGRRRQSSSSNAGPEPAGIHKFWSYFA